jgi:hypothetical protein
MGYTYTMQVYSEMISNAFTHHFKSLLAYSSTRMGYVQDVTAKVSSEEMDAFLAKFLPLYFENTGEKTPQSRVKYPVTDLTWTHVESQIELTLTFANERSYVFILQSESPPKKSYGGGMINNVTNQRLLEGSMLGSCRLLPTQGMSVVGSCEDLKPLQVKMNSLNIELHIIPGTPRISLIIKYLDREINIHTKTVKITPGGHVSNSVDMAKQMSQHFKYPVNLVVNNMRADVLKNLHSIEEAIQEKEVNPDFCIDWRIGSNQLKIIKTAREILNLIKSEDLKKMDTAKGLYLTWIQSELNMTVKELMGASYPDSERSIKEIRSKALIRDCVEAILNRYFSVLKHVNYFFINLTETKVILDDKDLRYVTALAENSDETESSLFCRLFIQKYGSKRVVITDGGNGAALGEPGYVTVNVPVAKDFYGYIRKIYRTYNVPLSEFGNTTGCGDAVASAMEFTFRCRDMDHWLPTRRLQFAQFIAAMVYHLDDSNLANVPQECVTTLVRYFESSVPTG